MKRRTTTCFTLTQDEVREAIALWFNTRGEADAITAEQVWSPPAETGNAAAIITVTDDSR